MDNQEVDRMEKSLQRMLDWIKAIDTKTQIALGLNVAMLGGLVAVTPKPESLNPAILGLLALGGLLPFVSCTQCIRAFFPNTKGPGDSRIFFGAIANRSLSGFRQALAKETTETYGDDLSEQVYRNAEIATGKYRMVKNAILLQGMAVVPWLIVCYFLFKGF